MFYIFLNILKLKKNSKVAWDYFFKVLIKLYQKYNITISANLVYCNDKNIFISRFINNDEDPPSLYFDDVSLIISSEPLSNNYKLVKKNNSIIIDIATKKIEINSL